METLELEFRGINRSQLCLYFEELGAEKRTDSLPYIFITQNWSAEIIHEEEISFTQNFKVNAVRIRFIADDETTLEQLVKNYRYKTTRVGG